MDDETGLALVRTLHAVRAALDYPRRNLYACATVWPRLAADLRKLDDAIDGLDRALGRAPVRRPQPESGRAIRCPTCRDTGMHLEPGPTIDGTATSLACQCPDCNVRSLALEQRTAHNKGRAR